MTNILRDIDEDAGIGRLYLPREGLLHAGITSDNPQKVIAEPALPKVCVPLVARARTHFEKADEIMRAQPAPRGARAEASCQNITTRSWRSWLPEGFAAPRAPVSLNKMARILILLRYAFI